MEQFTIDLTNFKASHDGDYVIVGGKKMRVVADYEFTFKLQKTQIRHSMDYSYKTAAESLAHTINKWIDACDAEDLEGLRIGKTAFLSFHASWASTCINHILKNGIPV